MTELKKEIMPLSEWVKFELETDLIDPPEIELRISPIYQIDTLDGIDDAGSFRFKKYYIQTVLECIKEWSLKRNDKLIPLDEEAKLRHLYPLLSAKIKGKKIILANEVYAYATQLDNFLKN